MPSLNTAAVDSQASNIATDYATATLTIYAGTPPANANTPLSGNNPLVVHTLTGWGVPSNGAILANAIADETITGIGTQTATFARLEQAGRVMQVTVGTGAQELVVSSTSYTQDGLSSINSLLITQPAA